MKQERKAFECLELRAEGEGESLPDLIGHAAVFNIETEINGFFGGFREKIAPGAFKRTLSEGADVRALFNHDPSMILGRTKAGTVELSEDSTGLLTRISPPDTQLGRDVTELIRRGDITQMSFGFIVRKEEVEEEEDQMPLRTVLDADLFDVSPVTFPAFEETDIEIEKNFRSGQEIWDNVIQMGKKAREADLAYRQKRIAYHRLKLRLAS